MNILVLHRIPYHKIQYSRGIDHSAHNVVYVGTQSALSNIPQDLRCTKVVRAGTSATAEEVIALFADTQTYAFDLVISLSEYELLDAARVREALGVPGPRPQDVLLVRDKILMKEAVARAGIRVPRHLSCDALPKIQQLPWTGKTILKPRDGASSEGVLTFAELELALAAIQNDQTGLSQFRAETFELEEFVEGDILHIDGLVDRGRVQHWLPSCYVGTCLGYALGQPLGSVQIEPTLQMGIWIDQVLKAVRITQGSFHLEAIVHKSDLVFLEVANRVGGADVVDSYELATGVYLPAAELAALTQNPLYTPRPRKPKGSFGWFVFPGHHLPAGPSCVDSSKDFQKDPHFLRVNILQDKPLPRAITYQALDVPLAGVVQGDNSQDLIWWMKSFFASTYVRSAPQTETIKETRCHA